MEKKNIKISLLNLESLVLIDLMRRFSQQDIEKISEEDVRKSIIDDSVKTLSAQSCFVKMNFDDNMEEFFKTLCAIQSATPFGFKEIYSLPDSDKSILFSYRILETIKQLKIIKPLEEITIDTSQIIESTIKTNLYKLLNEEFKVIKIDENLNLLIGKGYRETWDILNGIKQVFTTFRVFGSYEKGDKFSGFVCLFNSELDEINNIMKTNIAPFVEDFKHFLVKEKNDAAN